jgi:hypothetical protein
LSFRRDDMRPAGSEGQGCGKQDVFHSFLRRK